VEYKDRIEKLFDGEERDSDQNKELPEISPPSSTTERGEERRVFSRAGLSTDSAIQLRFSHDAQFAKSYIENISLGGLFVKTGEKRKVGELIDISFSIPDKEGSHFQFQLRARVCRAAPEGLGLEFTNLTNELRAKLEVYVRSVLPEGADVRTKAKQSTLNRLEELRSSRIELKQQQKNLRIKIVFLGCLALLNGLFFVDLATDNSSEAGLASSQSTFTLSGETISKEKVRSLRRSSDDRFVLELKDGQQIYFSANSSDVNQLPSSYRHAMTVMRTLPPPQTPRRSKNNPSGVVDLR